ncbi:MAG: FAD-dependent oxidoreductase [Phycisphaerae bacterium]|nr:FAD-dependent oxidoreductase [Phycisphaerae bacterium]
MACSDKERIYREPARDVPVLGEYDVVVVGGGPAGCAAAIAAARGGAEVLLVEKGGYLGGATVSQLVCVVLSTNGADFQGIWHEYMRGLKRRGGVGEILMNPGLIRSTVDPELVKYVWDELLAEAGVSLLHHVYCAGAIMAGGVIGGIVVETKAGRRAILAGRVIDATGDGIVCDQAGVQWEQGDGKHKYAMACTKVFRIANIHRPKNFPNEQAMEKLAADLSAAIERGEYTTPVVTTKDRLLNYIREGSWALPAHRNEIMSVISRVLKTNPLDPQELTTAEREGREQARQAADFYCRYVPGFENAYLLDTSNHIGVRSSRRIRGLATVTADDAREFRKYPDGIARGSWAIDVWPADSYTASAVDRESDEASRRLERLTAGEYYDIRYGCIVTEGVDNLLVAGRCISADHLAQSSLRIQQTCISTGQAAGTAAAMSLAENVTPRELPAAKVVAKLKADRDTVEPAFEILKGT